MSFIPLNKLPHTKVQYLPSRSIREAKSRNLLSHSGTVCTAVIKRAGLGHDINTVSLLKRKLFITRSCPIVVLTTVLGRPRRADVKNGVKNYQGPTTSLENAIPKIFPYVFLNLQ
jgi:hypothetical protein